MWYQLFESLLNSELYAFGLPSFVILAYLAGKLGYFMRKVLKFQFKLEEEEKRR